jgi:hypothetical protein
MLNHYLNNFVMRLKFAGIRMAHVYLFSFICVMAFFNPGPSYAQSPKSQVQYGEKMKYPPIEDLIGMEAVDVQYPNQWKYQGGGNVDKVNLNYTFSRVSRSNEHGLLLEVNLNNPKRGESLRKRIIDAVRVKKRPVDDESFSDYCKSKETNNHILAEVKFKRCQLVAVKVYRAWRVDPINWKFVSIDPQQVVCKQVAMGFDAEEGQVCPELRNR